MSSPKPIKKQDRFIIMGAMSHVEMHDTTQTRTIGRSELNKNYRSEATAQPLFQQPLQSFLVAMALALITTWSSWALAGDYIRACTTPEGHECLETAVATFVGADPSQTPVTLVGVVHIAEQQYYDALADILKKSDLEIFEGCAPIGFYGPPFINDPDFLYPEARVRSTRQRLFTLSRAIDHYRDRSGFLPEKLADILPEKDDRYFVFPDEMLDAWGRPFHYHVTHAANDTYELLSLGEDGKTGGISFDRDLSTADVIVPTFDSDRLVAGLREGYRNGAKKMELTNQPRSLSAMGSKFVRADVSSDLIFGDSNNKVAITKYWSWREIIPGLLLQLANEPDGAKPQSISILYGAGHGSKIESQILDQNYQLQSKSWIRAFAVTPDLSAEVQAARRQSIKKVQD